MDELARLSIVFEGQIKDVVGKLDELDKAVKGLADNAKAGTEKIGGGWKEMATGMIMGGLGIGSIITAFNTLKNTIAQSIAAYDEEFVAMKQISVLAGAQAGELEKLVQSRVKLTRYTEEEYRATEKNLLIHKLNADQIKQLMPVIEHYAAVTGRDLVSTANAFTMSIQYGSTRALRQYGIELDKSGSQQDIFNTLVGLGKDNASNLAEELNTGVTAGGISAGKAFQEMLEALGEFINQATPVAKILKYWADGVLELIGADEKLRFEENKRKWAIDEEVKKLEARKTVLENTMQAETNLAQTKGVIYNIGVEQTKKTTDLFIESNGQMIKASGIRIVDAKANAAELEKIEKRLNEIKGAPPSKLGTTPMGKGQSPEQMLAEAGLETYKKQLILNAADIDFQFKQHAVSIENWYSALTANINFLAIKESDAAKILLSGEPIKLAAKLEQIEIERKTKLIGLEQKLADERGKSAGAQAKINALLLQAQTDLDTGVISEKKAEISPVEKLKKTQVAQKNTLLKHLKDMEKAYEEGGSKDVEMAKAIEDQKTLIAKQGIQNRRDLEQTEKEYKLQIASQTFGNLASIAESFYKASGSKSAAAFAIYKAFAIAQATIDTYSSAVAAYRSMAAIPVVGPALGVVAAAAAIAAGIANVASIAKSSPPKAERGGMLHGARHSGGGILIEAEDEEYIQSRPATRYYGMGVMEALNKRIIPRSVFASFEHRVPTMTVGTFAQGGGAVGKTGAGSKVNVVIFDDRKAFDRYMSSAEGKNSVVHAIRGSSYNVKKALNG